MKIFETTERPSALITDLLQIWENSVRSTHTFLSESEILEIRKFVPQALAGVSRLVIATEITAAAGTTDAATGATAAAEAEEADFPPSAENPRKSRPHSEPISATA